MFYGLEPIPKIGPDSVVHQLPKQYFLCVGSLVQRKNQLQILKAWQQLVPTHQIPIVLVGRGKQYAKELKSYATAHQIPVYFLDQVSTLEELIAIYQKATLFIYPSLYEGFGLPVVEAQLLEVPVITSKYTSLKEAASPNASLIDPKKTEELAAAMTHLLASQEIYNQVKKEGKTYALSNFYPQIQTERLWNVYQYLT